MMGGIKKIRYWSFLLLVVLLIVGSYNINDWEFWVCIILNGIFLGFWDE